ncbi:hypothetical protein H0H81_003300 [Sphagnurus paluster]|uniref:Ribosomal RNA-processing protein 42 n=1 Tax=Sphagnurus paluster TaxID=117069 RepID=A0A9P7GSW7_9AGAR|nr:hypothetical protein H0H81_003300 [Sphagnurus paluster]
MLSISKAEKSYIQAGLTASPPSRSDGRGLLDCRSVALETGVAPLANGSARLSIAGATEVIAAAKLDVETVDDGTEGRDGGRLICTVSCSPSAYPNLSSSTLDDLQADLTSLLHTTLTHPTLHPQNLGILPGKKSWLLSLDVLVLADGGNVLDALFLASRAALWDTRVPRTRGVEYKARGRTAATATGGQGEGGRGDMDVDQEVQSGFDSRMIHRATDFELPDYWDEGEVLEGRERWPVAVTLNLEPPIHFLDATSQEEAASPLRLLLAFAFPQETPPVMQAMRMLGPGEVVLTELKELIKAGENYARAMHAALNTKLREEEVRRNQRARERFELHR